MNGGDGGKAGSGAEGGNGKFGGGAGGNAGVAGNGGDVPLLAAGGLTPTSPRLQVISNGNIQLSTMLNASGGIGGSAANGGTGGAVIGGVAAAVGGAGGSAGSAGKGGNGGGIGVTSTAGSITPGGVRGWQLAAGGGDSGSHNSIGGDGGNSDSGAGGAGGASVVDLGTGNGGTIQLSAPTGTVSNSVNGLISVNGGNGNGGVNVFGGRGGTGQTAGGMGGAVSPLANLAGGNGGTISISAATLSELPLLTANGGLGATGANAGEGGGAVNGIGAVGTNAGTSGAGGNGGSVSLNASTGSISFLPTASIELQGGLSGLAGSGGMGGTDQASGQAGATGAAGSSGAGGNGGTVTVTAASGKTTAGIVTLPQIIASGGDTTFGANGGTPAGASGASGGAGGDSGNGGNGGNVTVTAGGSVNLSVVYLMGGTSDHGGFGGNGSNFGGGPGFVPANGGRGGNAGNGGKGGQLRVSAGNKLNFNTVGVQLDGGNAGFGGLGGNAGFDSGAGAFGVAGDGGNAGNGGDAGNGAFVAKGTIFGTGAVTARGGRGGVGGNGAAPTSDGGNGGNGGNGGALGFKAPVLIAPLNSIPTFNVSAGSAGDGGNAQGGGTPGTDGTPGTNGSISDSIGIIDDGEDAVVPSGLRRRAKVRTATARGDKHLAPVAFVEPMLNLAERRLPGCNVLLCPNKRAAMAQAGSARVEVARGASAFVVNNGGAVSILALHESTARDITVQVGAQIVTLRAGEQLVISSDAGANYLDSNPLPGLAIRSLHRHALENGNVVFVSEFSLPSAMYQLHALRRLNHSSVATHRALYNKMLKDAAASMVVTGARGSYAAR